MELLGQINRCKWASGGAECGWKYFIKCNKSGLNRGRGQCQVIFPKKGNYNTHRGTRLIPKPSTGVHEPSKDEPKQEAITDHVAILLRSNGDVLKPEDRKK